MLTTDAHDYKSYRATGMVCQIQNDARKKLSFVRTCIGSGGAHPLITILHRTDIIERGIAEETSLALRTVRTIVEQGEGRDRTTRKYLERITPDKRTGSRIVGQEASTRCTAQADQRDPQDVRGACQRGEGTYSLKKVLAGDPVMC
jgi:hypothetical protein